VKGTVGSGACWWSNDSEIET